MSRPILFAVPADIELVPSPICPNWIIEGKPEARARLLAESADRTSSVMAWSCTAGRFRWCYAVDETVHIISGEVFVTDAGGATQRLGPGDMAFFPGGEPQHLDRTERSEKACRVPSQHSASIRLCAAGLEQGGRHDHRIFRGRAAARQASRRAERGAHHRVVAVVEPSDLVVKGRLARSSSASRGSAPCSRLPFQYLSGGALGKPEINSTIR